MFRMVSDRRQGSGAALPPRLHLSPIWICPKQCFLWGVWRIVESLMSYELSYELSSHHSSLASVGTRLMMSRAGSGSPPATRNRAYFCSPAVYDYSTRYGTGAMQAVPLPTAQSAPWNLDVSPWTVLAGAAAAAYVRLNTAARL